MATFDRSKFKKSKSLQQQQEELVESGKIKKKGSNGLPEILEFKEDGEYLLRFWPSHLNEEGDPLSYFMMLRRYTFLEFMKDKYDKDKQELVKDSNGNQVQELGTGIIIDSVVHGDTKLDLISEYKDFVRTQGMEMFENDKDGYKDYMKNIWGFGHGKNYFGGLKASEEFIAYGSLLVKDSKGNLVEKSFHRVVLKPSMRKEMLKLSASEDGGDGITTDPFTDPDDGFVVKIVRDSKKAKEANDPSLYYDVSFHTKNYIPLKWPLPDNMEEVMENATPLTELYENRYSVKDFNKALDGLTRFDEKYGYNIFSQDSWLDKCEEVALQYPDEDGSINSEEAPKPDPKPNVKKKVATKPKVEELPVSDPAEPENEEPFDMSEQSKPVGGGMSPQEKLAEMKRKAAGRAK
jgi:hypothetical protein